MRRRRGPSRANAARIGGGDESATTLTIERIAAGGDGVGRVNGMACFVPRTAPGDVVQIAYRTHARHARGRVLQILAPSADRVTALCRHYDADRCGGCQLQHLSAAAQTEARLGIVQDALLRIGKRAVGRPALHVGAAWAYRGRLTLTLRARGGSWIGGLHPHDDATRVFALDECPVAHPLLLRAWHAIRTVARGLPRAPELRLALRLTGASDTRVAVVIAGGVMWSEAREWAAQLMRTDHEVEAVWWQRADGRREALTPATDTPMFELRDADVPESPNGVAISGSAGGVGGVDDFAPSMHEALTFAQVNQEVAHALRAFVLAQVRSFQPRRVIDAYAGAGELTEALALEEVVAIESDATATARAALRLAHRANVQIVTGAVESVLASALPADVVVLNPPRRGVDTRVTALLNHAATDGMRGIVYVSCDPATLARDLARLPTWRIARIECFDMFPQTAHVETVCILTPGEL